MALATLSIDLEARLARMEQDLGRANRALDKFGNGAKRSMRGVEDAMSAVDAKMKAFAITVGASLAVLAVLAVQQLGNVFNGLVDGIDKLNDLADATGSSVENISALEDVAARTGTSIDTVASALVKFNAELSAAKPGSENANIFKKLGLDAEELKRIDPAEALLKTAQALAKFADDGDKARVVQALFGKSVREVGPYLKDLAEAGQLNATVTAEQAKAAEAFNRQVFQLQKNLTDWARSIAGSIIPAINDMIARLRVAAESMSFFELFKLGASQLMNGEQFTSAQQALDAYNGKLAETRATIDNLQKQQRPNAPQAAQAFDAQLQRLRDEEASLVKVTSLYRNLNALGSAGGGRGTGGPQSGKPGVGTLPIADKKGAKDKPDIFGPDVPASLADALKRIEGADENKLQRLRDVLAELVQQVRSGGKVPDSVFAAVAEDIAKLDPAGRAAKEAQDALNKSMEEGKRIFQETRTPSELLAAEIDRLNKLLELGAINWDTYARAQFDAQDRFDKATEAVGDKLKNTKSLAEELGLSFSSAFEDAIVNGGKLSDVLGGLEKDIIRIVTRKILTEPLGNALTNMLGGKGGSGGAGGGFLSGIGSFFSSLFGGFFADGGFLPPGKWGIAGERGPEPIFGGRSGLSIQPASSGMVVHQNFTVSGAVDSRTQQQLAAAAAMGLQRASRRLA